MSSVISRAGASSDVALSTEHRGVIICPSSSEAAPAQSQHYPSAMPCPLSAATRTGIETPIKGRNDAGLIYGQTIGDDDEAPFIADRERAAFGILTDVERANASLIITACNTHHDLVAALEAFVDDIDGRFGEVPEDCDAYHTAAAVLARLSAEIPG